MESQHLQARICVLIVDDPISPGSLGGDSDVIVASMWHKNCFSPEKNRFFSNLTKRFRVFFSFFSFTIFLFGKK